MSIKSKLTKKTVASLEKMTGGKLTLAKLIWAIRRCDELSQVEFAGILNISKQHLCDIEKSRKSVSPKLASEYAKLLGYSEKQFVRLAIQDELDRQGLRFQVELKDAA